MLYLIFLTIFAVVLYYGLRYLWELLPVGDLKNKAVFITGCDTGFGRMLAVKCAKNGIPVFAGCLTIDGQKSLEKETEGSPGKLITVPLDITKEESVAKAARFVKENLQNGQKLWALVNNAGYFSCYGPDAWCSMDQYKQAVEVNCFGMIRCVHAFLKLLKDSKGRIISVSSVAGRISVPCGAPYAVAKYGVEAYMDAIRQELKPYEIKCSILEPGAFRTNLLNQRAMKERVNKAWMQLSDDMQEEYGEEFKNNFVVKWNKGIHEIASDRFEFVVDNYYHAITAMFPRARYRCGWDALFFYTPLAYLPTELQDWVMTKVIGKTALPAVLEKKKVE